MTTTYRALPGPRFPQPLGAQDLSQHVHGDPIPQPPIGAIKPPKRRICNAASKLREFLGVLHIEQTGIFDCDSAACSLHFDAQGGEWNVSVLPCLANLPDLSSQLYG